MIYDIEEELEKYELAKNDFSKVPAKDWQSTEVVTNEDGRTYTAGVVDGMLFELQPDEEEVQKIDPAEFYKNDRNKDVYDKQTLMPNIEEGITLNSETDPQLNTPAIQQNALLPNAEESTVIPKIAEDTSKAIIKGAAAAGTNTTSFISSILGAPGDAANYLVKNLTGQEDASTFIGSEDINRQFQAGLSWLDENLMPDVGVDEWANKPYNYELYGEMAEMVAQFAAPAIPSAKIISGTQAIEKLWRRADLWIDGMKAPNPFVRGMVWGSIADAAAFPEKQETLTGDLAEYLAGQTPEERTEFGNFIVDVFQKNPEHAEIANRLKGSLEGFVLGGAIEGFIRLAVGSAKHINWKELLDRVEIDPNTVSMGGFGGINIEKNPARVGTTGQYVGYPEGINTPNKLYNLRNKLTNLAKEGEEGKYWYEKSGQAILDAVGGDKVEAEKVIQAIAITSGYNTPVQANMGFALQAYSQWKAGKEILTGKSPPEMSKRLKDLFEGKDWEGRKTNSFYNNLMRVIDPSKEQNVTADIWMGRILGLKNTDGTPFSKTPTLQQYNAIEREVNRIAKKLNWEPQQAQAAMWVAAKAKDTGKSLSEMKFDYSDALNNYKGQISWESIPGRTSGHLPEMFNAPYAQQVEYHQAVSKAFLDDAGSDLVTKELGLLTPGDFEAPGYFEGKVSPGTQTEIIAPKKYKGPAYGKVEPAVEELITAYATVRGVLLKQDGVGWHRPFYNSLKKDSNGIELRIGRDWSEAEVDQFAKILKELAGHEEYNPIASPEGIRILNFDFARKLADGNPVDPNTWIPKKLLLDNIEFNKLIKQAIDKMPLDDSISIDPVLFNSQNGYVGNDWSKFKNGEEYTDAVRRERRSDVYGKIRGIIKKIQPRIDDIDNDFSEKYGWTKNDSINTEFK